MSRAIRAANDQWKAWAWDQIKLFAAYGVEFYADDLEMERVRQGIPEPSSRNAVGALFNKAAKAGIIEYSGRMVHMKSEQAHARRTPLWVGTSKAQVRA